MAGMFYSLQEAAKRLNKTEEELKKLIKQGKLREFRIGTDLLLKVDEVEALASKEGISAPAARALTPEPEFPEEIEIPGPEKEQMEIPELEGLEPQEAEALLKSDELEDLGLEEQGAVVSQKQQPSEPEMAEVESARPKPSYRKATKKSKDATLPSQSIGQWLFRGLIDDNPVAIIVFCLMLCVVIVAIVAIIYFLYTLA